MAYIPPHKRHLKNTQTLSPTPYLLVPSKQKKDIDEVRLESRSLAGAKNFISRWLVVSSNESDDDHDAKLSSTFRLEQFSCEYIELQDGRKPLILVCDIHPQKDVIEMSNSFAKPPWLSIMEKIHQELLVSFQIARREMCTDGPVLKVPQLLFRFGKVIFRDRGIQSLILENTTKRLDVEKALSCVDRVYSTNIPESFVEEILSGIIQKIGVDLAEEKESYHVKIGKKYGLPADSHIACQCTVIDAAGKLDLCNKFELARERHLVVDISCLDKNQDLRLMLFSKRILNSLDEEEKHSLNDLLQSAVIDPKVKGGLGWPQGRESADDRFFVIGVSHTKSKIFKNSFVRLMIRHAERFDYLDGTGEVAQEANLRFTELNRKLRDETLELNPMTNMVRDAMELVWDKFLC